jgi:molecular chaperone GrpE
MNMSGRKSTDRDATPPSPASDPQNRAAVDAAFEKDETADEAPRGASPTDAATIEGELEQAKQRVLRVQAELENVRKRTARELSAQHRYAGLPLMRDLLPVLDNVHRAIEAADKAPEASGLRDGFELVKEQLKAVLAQHHCTEIEALHRPFDPHQHEAILQQPSAEYQPGTVLDVVQVGYQLHDRVVRPSQVIVAAAAAPDTE